MEHDKEESSDALLGPFLDAKSASTADELLCVLIDEYVDPIIKRILKSKLRVSLTERGTQQNQDALEIAGDLRATIIAALRALKKDPTHRPIVSFQDFVAIKAYSACADYFREKHPQRWRLKDLLRRHLKQNPRFALWQAEDHHWYAGFSGLQGWEPDHEEVAVSHSASSLSFEELGGAQTQPNEFLTVLFERAAGPVAFDEVVTIAAETWNVHDQPIESIDEWPVERNSTLTSPEPRMDLGLEQRAFLEHVWTGVCQLPVLQRAALLLNLRDAKGGGVIWFLPYLGIASKEELAQLLQIPYDDFQKLWTELPLDDLRIAQFFGITRQQVINLRKTARERLARRTSRLNWKSEKLIRRGKN
jgi:hypothetical protein